MPIRFESFDIAPICKGHNWIEIDEAKLAALVAHLLIGRYRHVLSIINGTPVTAPATTAAALEAAKQAVAAPTSDAKRYHRDGWVFQMISWIASQSSAKGKTLSSIPHSQPADKGFDSLSVQVSNTDPAEVEAVIICEDKATENSRTTITGQVWPDFKSCEAGERDNELLAETTALLERLGAANIDKLVENIHWDQRKTYKVSISVNGEEHDDDARRDLFESYDGIVTGNVTRRAAATLIVENIRDWMDEFCEKVSNQLAEME